MNINMEFDVHKVCRVCLEEGILTSVFTLEFLMRPSDMMMNCATVKIFENDGLPPSICSNCIYRLGIAYQFKQQCENSDIRLRQYLGVDISSDLKNSVKQESMEDSCIQTDISDNATQVKDEEIYAAMNVVCEILGDAEQNAAAAAAVAAAAVSTNIPLTSPTEETVMTQDIIEPLQEILQTPKKKTKKNKLKLKRGPKSRTYEELLARQRAKKKEQDAAYKLSHPPKEKKKRGPKPRELNLLKEPEQCFECGKTFNYSGYLEAHLRTHTGEKPFECNVCKRKFAQTGNLALHMRTHTGEKPFQCEICSKMFSTSSNLHAHQKIHSGVRDFACSLCPRAFKSSTELASHAGTHTGIKNHICKMCGKAFYKTSYLNVHMRTVHIGEKRHKCTECGKEFSNSSNLTCHFRIHTGEKPFCCKYCNARFNQSSALQRHIKQHTDGKGHSKTAPSRIVMESPPAGTTNLVQQNSALGAMALVSHDNINSIPTDYTKQTDYNKQQQHTDYTKTHDYNKVLIADYSKGQLDFNKPDFMKPHTDFIKNTTDFKTHIEFSKSHVDYTKTHIGVTDYTKGHASLDFTKGHPSLDFTKGHPSLDFTKPHSGFSF